MCAQLEFVHRVFLKGFNATEPPNTHTYTHEHPCTCVLTDTGTWVHLACLWQYFPVKKDLSSNFRQKGKCFNVGSLFMADFNVIHAFLSR